MKELKVELTTERISRNPSEHWDKPICVLEHELGTFKYGRIRSIATKLIELNVDPDTPMSAHRGPMVCFYPKSLDEWSRGA